MNFSTLLSGPAQRFRSQPAVRCGDDELTYGQLEQRVHTLAAAFSSLGMARGARVAVLLPNCMEHVEVVLALAHAGAIWVPLNYRLAFEEMSFIVEDSDADTLVAGTTFVDVAQDLRSAQSSRLDRVVVVPTNGDDQRVAAPDIRYADLLTARPGTERRGAGGGTTEATSATMTPERRGAGGGTTEATSATMKPPPDPAGPDDAFALMYTSGTTGRPKGTLLTHRQFLAGTRFLAQAIQPQPDDRKLLTLPQFHAGGAIYQFAYLMSGATLVVLPQFDPQLVETVVREQEISVLGLVPTMLHQLVGAGVRGHRMPTLRRILYGGAPITAPQLMAAMNEYPVEFVQTYGQTESGVISMILDGPAHERAQHTEYQYLLTSCGRPIPGYSVQLRDPDSGHVGDSGEILVRSESVMQGYWRRPDATAETLVDGWLRSGDLGRRDDDGYYYLVDRLSSMIVSGGENIYPSEVESVLAQHPNVADVMVAGVPDDTWGEAVVACVVSLVEPRPTLDDLQSFCDGRLARYKMPKGVYYVSEVPRNASGKLLRRRLPDRPPDESSRR